MTLCLVALLIVHFLILVIQFYYIVRVYRK